MVSVVGTMTSLPAFHPGDAPLDGIQDCPQVSCSGRGIEVDKGLS